MKKSNKKFDNLVTKKYVDKKFMNIDKKFKESQGYMDKRFERLFKYLDHRFEPLEQMQKDFSEFKNNTYNRLDWIIKLLTKYDQEYTVLSDKYITTDGKLDNHETRISALEKKTVYKTS